MHLAGLAECIGEPRHALGIGKDSAKVFGNSQQNKNMIPATEFKRRYFDVSTRISNRVCDGGGLTAMAPYIMARQSDSPIGNCKYVPFWLEHKPYGLPDESDFAHQPDISPLQQLNTYDELPQVELVRGKLETVKAVAERIPDGDVAYIPVGSGYLWTMTPRTDELQADNLDPLLVALQQAFRQRAKTLRGDWTLTHNSDSDFARLIAAVTLDNCASAINDLRENR